MFEKARDGNIGNKEKFVAACNFIGLLNENKDKWMSFKKNKIQLSETEINSMIYERNKARDNKNYELADKIRNDLIDKGILIEDKDGKTTWKIK